MQPSYKPSGIAMNMSYPTPSSFFPPPIVCITNNSLQNHIKLIRPNITYIDPPVGDASGRSDIRFYGHNLGSNDSLLGVTINDKFLWKACDDVIWGEAMNYNPDMGHINTVLPYIQCVSKPTTVGYKNVTLYVDVLMSLPYSRYEVECKKGFYGDIGEYCVNCYDNSTLSSHSVSTGMNCPYDNMTSPISSPGSFYTYFYAYSHHQLNFLEKHPSFIYYHNL